MKKMHSLKMQYIFNKFKFYDKFYDNKEILCLNF